MKTLVVVLLNFFYVHSYAQCPVGVQCSATGAEVACGLTEDQGFIVNRLKTKCPKWVKKKKTKYPCPKNGVKVLPDYYPQSGVFLNNAGGSHNTSSNYSKIIERDILLYNKPKRAPAVFDSYYFENYFMNASIEGNNYLRDGMISGFSKTGGEFHIRTNMKENIHDPFVGDDLAVFLKACGYEVKASHDKKNAETPEMGGNLISPVPGICATNNKSEVKHFKQFGCTKENTISLNPSVSYWGGVGHIDEKLATVPNPKSKKSPPCNFSLVVQAPHRTLSLLEKSDGDELFFNLKEVSRDNDPAKGPRVNEFFDSWDEAHGVKNICNEFRELFPQAETKPCKDLTNSDVLKIYKKKNDRVNSAQKNIDDMLLDLRTKMKKMNNICGDGSDLDIIYTHFPLSNALANPTNLIVTSPKSVAYGNSLSNVFERDLHEQYSKRGVISTSISDVYERLLKSPRGATSSGGLHCLTNSLKICK